MTPRVTVGIAFRNPGRYFEPALNSVLLQTFTDWELILVDDGSSDESLTLARSLKDPRVRVYSDGLSKRLNARLNELVTLARAPYFFRMDADDIMHPERLERQLAELLRHGNDTVIGSSAYSIDSQSNIVGFRQCRNNLSGFAAHLSFIHPSVAAATEWFRRNPYSESFIFHRSQDAELWCRTAPHSKFINLPEPLLYYREAGVFSYENYLGSQLGLIFLLRTRFCQPRWRCFAGMAKGLGKVFSVSAFDALGLGDIVVGRRFKRLTPEQRRRAEDGLTRILSCPPRNPSIRRDGSCR
jgi:glycosyltransferase involved in cell wall biosynthesis